MNIVNLIPALSSSISAVSTMVGEIVNAVSLSDRLQILQEVAAAFQTAADDAKSQLQATLTQNDALIDQSVQNIPSSINNS